MELQAGLRAPERDADGNGDDQKRRQRRRRGVVPANIAQRDRAQLPAIASPARNDRERYRPGSGHQAGKIMRSFMAYRAGKSEQEKERMPGREEANQQRQQDGRQQVERSVLVQAKISGRDRRTTIK